MSLEWKSQADWDNKVDESGVVHDSLSDNPGEGSVRMGYEAGSLTRDIVGYWKFDDDSDTTTAIDHALGNDGTINGASYVSGYINQALTFDGTDDTVDGIAGSGNFSSCTFSAWVKADGFGSKNGIARWWVDNDIIFESNTTPEWVFFLDGTSVSTTAGTDTNWHLITGTWDGSTLRIYVDGTEQASASQSTNAAAGETDNVIGGTTGSAPISNFFDGEIDDFRVYNRALSQPEIEALYNLTQPTVVTAGDTL